MAIRNKASFAAISGSSTKKDDEKKKPAVVAEPYSYAPGGTKVNNLRAALQPTTLQGITQSMSAVKPIVDVDKNRTAADSSAIAPALNKPAVQPTTGTGLGGYVPPYPTYTSPTAGATWNYGVARPEWGWNEAEPTYAWNEAAPTWQWDDSGRPAAFTYDESTRPGAFEWDDSARPADFAYDQAAPTYDNAYQERINAMVDQILNRPEFSYDYNADPLYQQYAEAYTRNGNQAMTDTYAQMAARTGGLGSSYAGTASQQVYNQYMQQLNDKIPELYQLAYGMYQDQGNTMRNNLSMLQGLESTDYGRYMDALGQYNTDRNLAYNVWANGLNQYNTDRNFAYNQWADQVNQWNADRDFAYNMSQDEWNRYYNDRNFSYGQYQDALAQYNNDRNFSFDQYQTALNQYNNNRYFDYGVYQDALGQWNTDRNWDYNLWQDNLARQEAAAKAAYNSQVAAYNAANRGSGSGSRSSGNGQTAEPEPAGWASPYAELRAAGIRTKEEAMSYLMDVRGYDRNTAGTIADGFYNSLSAPSSNTRASASGTETQSAADTNSRSRQAAYVQSSALQANSNAAGKQGLGPLPSTSAVGRTVMGGYTFNGQAYGSLDGLANAIQSVYLTDAERKLLQKELDRQNIPITVK